MRLTRVYFRAIRYQLRSSLAQNRQLLLFVFLLAPMVVVLPLAVFSIIFSDQYHVAVRLLCFALLLFVMQGLLRKMESVAHSAVDIAYLDYLAAGQRKFSWLLLLWFLSLPVVEVVGLAWFMARVDANDVLLVLAGYLLLLPVVMVYVPRLADYPSVFALLLFCVLLDLHEAWLFAWACGLMLLLFLPGLNVLPGVNRVFFLRVYAQDVRAVLAGAVFVVGMYALVTRGYGYHVAEIWPVILVSLLLMNVFLLASRKFVYDHKAFGSFVDYLAVRRDFLLWQGFGVFAGLFALALWVLVGMQSWSLLFSAQFLVFQASVFALGLWLLRRESRNVFLLCNVPGFAALLWQVLP